MITLENGGVQNASSMFVPNGSISFQLNVDATVVAAPYGFVSADIPVVFQLDASGDILPLTGQAAAQIWSNAELNPQNPEGLGTYYLVTIYDQNGARLSAAPMWWQFQEAAGSTVDISSMTPVSTVGGNVIYYPILGSISYKPAAADAVQFVTTEGSDSNDGLSWGTAKATIQAAVNALPSVTYQSATWSHCGTIYVGAGSFTVSSSISISSPYVRIQGRGATVTILNYTGSTGSCFEWTANPFNSGKPQTNAGGLFDLTIDGSGASAGTGGLHTYDIIGFKAHGLAIGKFQGSGSFGWHQECVTYFCERFDVSMELAYNTTAWWCTAGSGDNTTGYGKFRLWINTPAGGVAVLSTGVTMTASNIFIVLDGANSTDTGVKLTAGTNPALWYDNLYSVWLEDVVTGLNVASTCVLQGNGVFTNNRTGSDSISGTVMLGGYNGSSPYGFGIGGPNGVITFDTTGDMATPGNILVGGSLTVASAPITGTGTLLSFGNTTGFGNGSSGTAVTTTTKSTGTGPATPQTVVKYLEIDLGGTKYWLPLVQ